MLQRERQHVVRWYIISCSTKTYCGKLGPTGELQTTHGTCWRGQRGGTTFVRPVRELMMLQSFRSQRDGERVRRDLHTVARTSVLVNRTSHTGQMVDIASELACGLQSHDETLMRCDDVRCKAQEAG